VLIGVSGHNRNNFDAIRLAMALLVVWSHSFALHLGSEKTEWVSLALNGAFNAGNLAVMAFFIISGFLITQSFERSRSLVSYMQKRVKRIYPGYLVATSLSAFVVAPLFGAGFPSLGKTLGLNLLLRNEIPDGAFAGNPAQAVNGSLWSIALEFWCYIGVAVAGVVLLKRPRLLIGLCLLMLIGRVVEDVTGKKPDFWIFGWSYFWMRVGPCFLLGMIAYCYRDFLPRRRSLLVGLAGAAVLACWMSQHLADMLVAPALAYGVFYCAYSERVTLHDAGRFGDFSYGTYLYAFPIQQMLQATVAKDWGLPLFIAVSAALALFTGVLSWHLVEKRFTGRSAPKPVATEPIAATA
jgi:peptidoglycan/LPS O-acetylase OafA/YrhL